MFGAALKFARAKNMNQPNILLLSLSALLIGFFLCKRMWLRIAIGLELLGWICNALAVFSNGGMMPVRVPPSVVILSERHQYMTPDTKLQFLCDVYHFGKRTFSVGDVFVWANLVLMALVIARVAFHWQRRHVSA